MLRLTPPTEGSRRTFDGAGGGGYMDSRSGGRRRHVGLDWLCMPTRTAFAMGPGTVFKVGFMYADAAEYRYVEVTAAEFPGVHYRVAYLQPAVDVGEQLERWQPIGVCRDVGQYYKNKGSTVVPPAHLHIEVRAAWGVRVYPWPGTTGQQRQGKATTVDPLLFLDEAAQPPGGW